MKPIRCFIFDLDGTLVFNENANAQAYQAAFASIGLHITPEEYKEYFGLGVHDLVKTYAKRHGIAYSDDLADQLISAKATEYKKRLGLIELNQAVVGLLKALSPHYHTALATTASKHNGMAVLDNFELTKYFGLTIFRNDVTRTKPDPECHKIIATHFNVEPDECMIFEDSHTGFAAAKAFGAHICKVIR